MLPVLLHVWRPRCCRFCCICGVLGVAGFAAFVVSSCSVLSVFFCVCGVLGVTGFLLRLWCPRCCRFYCVCGVSGLSFEMSAISSHTHTHGGAPLVFGDWTRCASVKSVVSDLYYVGVESRLWSERISIVCHSHLIRASGGVLSKYTTSKRP